MVMAEALLRKRLGKKSKAYATVRLQPNNVGWRGMTGRDWLWSEETTDPAYLEVVSLFEDSKKPVYSIHQIALMGESTEKKPVGTWFGPNTVAQVLR